MRHPSTDHHHHHRWLLNYSKSLDVHSTMSIYWSRDPLLHIIITISHPPITTLLLWFSKTLITSCTSYLLASLAPSMRCMLWHSSLDTAALLITALPTARPNKLWLNGSEGTEDGTQYHLSGNNCHDDLASNLQFTPIHCNHTI